MEWRSTLPGWGVCLWTLAVSEAGLHHRVTQEGAVVRAKWAGSRRLRPLVLLIIEVATSGLVAVVSLLGLVVPLIHLCVEAWIHVIVVSTMSSPSVLLLIGLGELHDPHSFDLVGQGWSGCPAARGLVMQRPRVENPYFFLGEHVR